MTRHWRAQININAQNRIANNVLWTVINHANFPDCAERNAVYTWILNSPCLMRLVTMIEHAVIDGHVQWVRVFGCYCGIIIATLELFQIYLIDDVIFCITLYVNQENCLVFSSVIHGTHYAPPLHGVRPYPPTRHFSAPHHAGIPVPGKGSMTCRTSQSPCTTMRL